MIWRTVKLVTAAAAAAVLVAGSATASASSAAAASARGTATTGVVVVNTTLAYGGSGTATGIVLTSSGRVLTNNHVIRGAKTIRVTDVSTGRTYSAAATGYSVSKDVALLQLKNAYGLRPVVTGNSATVRVGDAITTVGNGGGAGLRVKTGKVTGLRQTITVSDEDGPTRLVGLIETTAPLEPGDSGGPLLGGGKVVGIDAAATSSFSFQGAREGYAIPINVALRIAKQIAAGRRSATVHVGPTAFLGVALARTGPYGPDVSGALVEEVASGSPAEKAGIGADDLIVSFAGRKVSSATSLRRLVLQVAPGHTVRVAWIDRYTGSSSARVRLASGPPQ